MTMQPDELAEVLNRPLSQELLSRDVTRLAYVAKDGTPRNVPIIFTWNGSEIVMCTPKNAEAGGPACLIDFETTLPSAVEELIQQRDERQRV